MDTHRQGSRDPRRRRRELSAAAHPRAVNASDIFMSSCYVWLVRTTVRLDDELLSAAKQRAAADHTTLTALIEDSLRQTLAVQPAGPGERFSIRPFGANGTLPGVDLEDSAALRDLMDGLR
jgi:hypothetical protein